MAADFSSILTVANAATAVSAVLAAAALVGLVHFATWASKKTGTFFDGDGTRFDDGTGSMDVCETCGGCCDADEGTIIGDTFYCEWCQAEENERQDDEK